MDLEQDLKYVFSKWLEEEYNIKVQRGQRNAPTYLRAMKSVKLCPYPLKHPKQLQDLKFVGEKLVNLMTSKLEKYCSENGYNFPKFEGETDSKEDESGKKENDMDDKVSKKRAKKSGETGNKRKRRRYIPAKDTGGYGILLTLYIHDRERQGLTKNEIIAHVAPYCSASFTSNPSTGQFYSAWNSVNTLLKNEYVLSQGRPTYFYLTNEGEEVAKVLKKVHDESQGARNDVIDSSPITGREQARVRIEDEAPCSPTGPKVTEPSMRLQFHGVNYSIWTPNSYDIVFVSDTREIRSQNERDFFSNHLRSQGMTCEVRALSVGDGVWVAINKQNKQWAALDFIFERKRLDDFAESIKDGRFREQKSRLERTGLKRIIYLVEEQMSSDISRFSEALQTSMSMAITYSNFHLKRTRDSDETVRLLLGLNTRIQAFYRDRSLVVLEPRNLRSQQDYKEILDEFREHFEEKRDEEFQGFQGFQVSYNFDTFQSIMSKSNMTTVGEMFIRMLMTVRGVSLDKAIEIQKHFKTPKLLIESYRSYKKDSFPEDEEKEKAMMIHDLFKDEVGIRKIGPSLSKKIYEVWGLQ
ncbi:DEKNAAC102663 [Brettanomyces naardenensis]|uniref:Crossover junction endonuclease MUS81 n=1 Tax=Brettanomyces naardenensis TaxID=13370 RepID=A0A448YK89_BRENA|nr:DEKNAAC102663 [Brettanomyces naardenensis]